ncbi:cyclohexanecarboxylate-CoA ligase [Mangrovimicrobium sediminis]|uniref:Cyclohexanecarboxylate-CoA ligase n=1 Tax=Mangrovimicrobium sediminis TaxID=2562682 RepID=A0A4Z0LVX5_9GAMM|nr:AMP-binding protein [Haliea sp. SAOS-164]TGD71296.1 cyclohexanecarboxylate-CoA ligase [Haliea sp. SAOS-164]
MSWKIRHDVGGFPLRCSAEHEARWREAGYWREETLADVAREQARLAPQRALLIEGGRTLTRGEVYSDALRLARYFLERGARAGDVVAFQLPNWSESAVIALAARMLGLVICPVPPIYRESELLYILGETAAKFLFVPREFRKCDYPALVAGLRDRLPQLHEVIVLRGDAGTDTPWATVLASEPLETLPEVDPGAAFMVMFTSGTTGRAKGVLQTHYGFGYKARQMVEAWGVGEGDVIFMPSPVTHITGAIWAFDIPWISGAPAVLLDVWQVQDAIDAIREYRCTISGGATPFLQQFLAATADDRAALASLRTFFCGGTSVSPELIRQVSQAFPGCLFFRAYGSTEMMTVTLGISSREQAALGAETDGVVLPPIQVKLVDDDGNDIEEDGVEGEILAMGPEQFAGYLDPQDNAGAFDDNGFFRMGDLGRWCHGNYLEITGRKKDIIIRSGENISPKEVEDVLMQHPAIADIAIVAMPSAATGEMGCAFVIPAQGASIDLADMRRFLDGAGLAKQKYPEWLECVADFPRVPSGKVRKDELRRLAQEIAGRQREAQGQ